MLRGVRSKEVFDLRKVRSYLIFRLGWKIGVEIYDDLGNNGHINSFHMRYEYMRYEHMRYCNSIFSQGI